MSNQERFIQIDASTEEFYNVDLPKLSIVVVELQTKIDRLTPLSERQIIIDLIQEYFKLKNTFEKIRNPSNAFHRALEGILDLFADRTDTQLKQLIDTNLNQSYRQISAHAAAKGIKVTDITDSNLLTLTKTKNDDKLVPEKESRKYF